jgi:hypothetical protein
LNFFAPTFARRVSAADAREAEAEARTANMMLCDERVKCACARAGMERRSSEGRVTSKRARAESHPTGAGVPSATSVARVGFWFFLRLWVLGL